MIEDNEEALTLTEHFFEDGSSVICSPEVLGQITAYWEEENSASGTGPIGPTPTGQRARALGLTLHINPDII